MQTELSEKNGWKFIEIEKFSTTSKSLTRHVTYVLKKGDVSVTGSITYGYEFSKFFDEMTYSLKAGFSDEYLKTSAEAYPHLKERYEEYQSLSLSAKYKKVEVLPNDLKFTE